MFKKDIIFTETVETIIDFSFDEKVAQVFPDMVHRSIPGYTTLLTLLQSVFASHFGNYQSSNQLHSEPNLKIYDLGCSVGAVTIALSKVLPINSQFIAVDISNEMLSQCEKAIKKLHKIDVIFIKEDIRHINLEPCHAICINFTLQFLPEKDRKSVLEKCYRALLPNGVLFLAEKARENDHIIQWHEQFKRNNGYSELEISQKRSAIEHVMQIDSEETILNRLQHIGFNAIPIFQALSFKAWVAIK